MLFQIDEFSSKKAGPHLKIDINSSPWLLLPQIITALAIASAVLNFPILPELTGFAGTILGNYLGSKPIILNFEIVS